MLKAIAAKACALLIGAALLMVPALGWAQYQQGTPAARGAGPPPIEQPLIREGSLAVDLVAALNLGATSNEVEAETLLGQAGISPKNGWIADYPVTPDIIGELEAALGAASDAHRIALSKDEAVSRLDSIMVQLGVEVSEANNATPPATEEQNIVPVEEIYNYYYDEGPPIITYYAPPEDYYYLYSWVPYPFWCNGFWFGGFFVLNDFDRPFFHHGHHHHGGQFISNHFRNPATNGFARINPATRSFTPAFAGIGAPARFAQGATTGAGSRLANRPVNGFTPRPPAPAGAGMNFRTRLSPWTRSNSASTRTGRFTPGSHVNPSGAITRNGGYAPQDGNSSRFHAYSPPARSYNHGYSPQLNGLSNSRAYSAPARSFTARSYSPQKNNFGNYRSYSPPARSFTPHGSFSAPSFHGGFSAAPSFHGGFSAGPSFRGGGGFSGGRGGRR